MNLYISKQDIETEDKMPRMNPQSRIWSWCCQQMPLLSGYCEGCGGGCCDGCGGGCCDGCYERCFEKPCLLSSRFGAAGAWG